MAHPSLIEIGDLSAFTSGCWLWSADSDFPNFRISVGNRNYFNRDGMIEACGLIEIGDENMFDPAVYITDSNHGFGPKIEPLTAPMGVAYVKIGKNVWIGPGAIIGTSAVVTKMFGERQRSSA